MMVQRSDFRSSPELDYEGWRDALRPQWGRYSHVAIEPQAFTGSARPRSLYGLAAIDLSCNAHRIERTQQDVRLDRVDHYFTFFQVAGGSTIIQNDQAVRLAVGDAVLVDLARPATYLAEDGCGHWISLQLPRRSLASHLGFDPHGGTPLRGGTPAKRLLFDLVGDADAGDSSAFSPTHSYMRLAVYDLVGALVAPSDPRPVLRHTDKLFARIRGVIQDGFADPDFDPCAVAAKTGISLRYVQKLFTARGSTCCEFIYSLRLDQAARLLQRRASLGTGQPLSEIAYACGFRDYTHFARKFRRRFGYTPGAHAVGDGRGTADATEPPSSLRLARFDTRRALTRRI